jgi:uracil-DNA glycosylase family 4
MKGFFTREEIETQAVRKIEESAANCIECGLYNKCRSPKMEFHGEGRLNCLLLAEAPGGQEDEYGTQLVGPTGDFFKNRLLKYHFYLKRDFYRLNAVNCRPSNPKGGNRTPTPHEINCCRPMVLRTINELTPKFIWPMGGIAIESLLGGDFDRTSIGRWRGTFIPDQKFGCWIMPLYHPSYPNRDNKNRNLSEFYNHDLRRALEFIQQETDKDFPVYTDGKEKVDVLVDHDMILSALRHIDQEYDLIHIDYETTGLKPYIPGHRIASVAISMDDRVISFPYEYASFFTNKQRLLIKRGLRKIWKNEKIRKVAHNAKFEHIWTTNILDCKPANWYWCTLQGAHIQDNRQAWTGLKFQTYIHFGQRPWGGSVERYLKSDGEPFNNVDKCPIDDLLLYGGLDVHWTHRLHRKQERFYRRSENKGLKFAFDLFNEGSIALAKVQDNGVHVDEEYCHAEQQRFKKRINVIEKRISGSDEATLFKERTGRTLSLKDKDYSDNDLRILFYDILNLGPEAKDGEPPPPRKVDEEALRDFESEVADLVIKRRKFRKIEGTYLSQFIRETFHGEMHPFYDLIVPVSYRGSAYDPNFQNIPKRDEQAKKATRRAIIPSEGNQLLESDFSGIEVAINACYNQDPTLIADVTDPDQDMHRDSAADLWMIPIEEVHKKVRFYGKNQWVFPQFYGSWYMQCAKNLWRTANRDELRTISGKRLIDIMASKGIMTLEQFEEHCKEVEKKFWKERFQVYNQWKFDIQRTYQLQGYIETFLGFQFKTYMGRNECTNYPAQGTAFHILLWTLINVQREMERYRMKSKLIGQIHDSMINDAVPNEVNNIIELVDLWGTKKTRETFEWISVPLKIDHELTDINDSWYLKKEVK